MSERKTSSESWETTGRRAAPLVEKLSVVLVAGTDPDATAGVALGIARVESSRRAVTVADIWGDLAEIEELTAKEDPHGISDHLNFGISLARLRTPAEGNPTLQLIKSGTDDIAQESLLSADRWDSIFASYRSVGALLVLPCHTGTPGLESLSRKSDGVIVVGDMAPAVALSGIVAAVRPAEKTAPVQEPASREAAPPQREEVRRSRPTPAPRPVPTARESETSLWRTVQRWPVAIVLAIAGIGVVGFVLIMMLAKSGGISLFSGSGGSRPVADNPPATTTQAATPAAPAIINPDDAPEAARFSVEIANLNTRAGADMRLAELRDIPGSTISPVLSADGESWYRVFAGAFRSRESADSLQAELRSRSMQMADGDRVVELPIAVQLTIHPPNTEAAATLDLQRYISIGIPAYLLAQTDGSLIIYAGGFETMEQASHFGEICTKKGIPPRLAYRTGR